MPDQQPAAFDQWGIVEILGHKKLAGHITEEVIAGVAFVRIDVPEIVREEGRNGRVVIAPFTRYVGPSSIYSIHPSSEEVARAAAQQIFRWQSPLPIEIPQRLLPSVTAVETDLPADMRGDDERDFEQLQEEDDDEDDGLPFDGGASEELGDDPEARGPATQHEDPMRPEPLL